MGLKDWWYKLKSKPVTDVIKHKHRFVVMDTDTFKEKFSFQLSGINLFVTIGITVITLIVLTTVLIAFTPLREFIPGYTNTEMTEQTYVNAKKIDSLEAVLVDQEWLIATMQAVMRGDEVGSGFDSVQSDSNATLMQLAGEYRHSKADSLLREEVEREDNSYEVKTYAAHGHQGQAAVNQTLAHLFFAPIKGNVIRKYDAAERQYGVDIAAGANKPVAAAYNGTVIFSGFSGEAGYALAIQHPGNVVTLYRNINTALRHQGDAVRAGEPIAYSATGKNDEHGPYLHLEIWVNGTPVNPEDYISF